MTGPTGAPGWSNRPNWLAARVQQAQEDCSQAQLVHWCNRLWQHWTHGATGVTGSLEQQAPQAQATGGPTGTGRTGPTGPTGHRWCNRPNRSLLHGSNWTHRCNRPQHWTHRRYWCNGFPWSNRPNWLAHGCNRSNRSLLHGCNWTHRSNRSNWLLEQQVQQAQPVTGSTGATGPTGPINTNAWLITGNAGTNPTGYFIGTTDTMLW